MHDRLGYEGQHRWRQSRRRRRREYGDSYGRAWSRWNYGYSYQPLYDSSDEWVDYDDPRYSNDNLDNYIDYDDPNRYNDYDDSDRYNAYDDSDRYNAYDDWTSPAYDWTSPRAYNWTSPAYFGAAYIMFVCTDFVVL